MSGGIVAASAHGHCQLESPGEIEGCRDIAWSEATRDHCGPAVDESVEAPTRRVVIAIGGSDDRAGQRPPEIVQTLH